MHYIMFQYQEGKQQHWATDIFEFEIETQCRKAYVIKSLNPSQPHILKTIFFSIALTVLPLSYLWGAVGRKCPGL